MTKEEAALQVLETPETGLVAPITVDAAQSVVKRKKTTTGPTETSLQALVRILGPDVIDVIPEDVQNAVRIAYKFWQEHPDSYLVTEFPDEASKRDALAVMKAFAEIAPEGPYTIRVDWDSEPNVLHWRAQTRQGRKAATE